MDIVNAIRDETEFNYQNWLDHNLPNIFGSSYAIIGFFCLEDMEGF